ncbi:MAG: NIPSNAP family protein [Pirellulaceae bacterium]
MNPRSLVVAFLIPFIFSTCSSAQDATAPREFYEVRVYQVFDYEKQAALHEFLRSAYLPALERLGIDRVGVFSNMKDENDHSVFMLIPFRDVQQFTTLREQLQQDAEFAEAEAAFGDRAVDDPVFTRIESRFMRAFASMPVMELADYSTNKTDRIFELRLYESHTSDHARRKVQMFDAGETQLMRDVGMGPVFFGETLIGPTVPNLVYMLSAESEDAHKQHWQAFLDSPRWAAMKDLPEYKDTVSKIRNWYLVPLDFSGI